MTTSTRVPGKYGRRAPKNAPAIRLGAILRAGATIPPHPASEDYLGSLSHWNMLGNDVAGDCVPVTWANFRRLVTKFLGDRENYPSQDQVWELYRTQNPDFDPNGSADTNGPGSQADQGMDIQTLLEYLVTHGGPDGVKALAFAKVDFTNEAELDAALAIFGGVWTGIVVQEAQMDQFNAGQPWDYVPGSPTDGGHSVISGGYDNGVKFITWAAETEFTDAYRTKMWEEAWVVIWPEHLGTKAFEAGIDQAALAQAYQELTGKPFPVRPPAPTPVPPAPVPPQPVPTPTPQPSPDVRFDVADETLVAALTHWMKERHVGDNHHAVLAFEAWLEAKQAAGA